MSECGHKQQLLLNPAGGDGMKAKQINVCLSSPHIKMAGSLPLRKLGAEDKPGEGDVNAGCFYTRRVVLK